MLENSPEGTYLIQKMGENSDKTPYAIFVRRYSANSNELKTKKILVLAVQVGSGNSANSFSEKLIRFDAKFCKFKI
jgi:hypothetical protein